MTTLLDWSEKGRIVDVLIENCANRISDESHDEVAIL